jgi:hypothetical protein
MGWRFGLFEWLGGEQRVLIRNNKTQPLLNQIKKPTGPIMTHLYEPARHTHLISLSWDPEFVRSRIVSLVEGVVSKQGLDGLWPTGLEGFESSLYEGAAGIRWGVQQLSKRGFVDGLDRLPRPEVKADYSNWMGDDGMFLEHKVPRSYSFYLGLTGPLLQHWVETGDRDALETLDQRIGENLSHPWMENLWGAPSTMIAASHLFEQTGDERFAEHLRVGADYLWERLETVEALNCKLWNINLYGQSSYLMGAGHGFVGNVFPVLKSQSCFSEAVNSAWKEMIFDTVLKTAMRQDGLTNWAPRASLIQAEDDKILVQQCHGAPGFVISLGSLMGCGNDEFDVLMKEAGELIWRAGPLSKYPELCHGTPGNGYAFLKLFEKTGDELWLSRARDFANFSYKQREEMIRGGKPQQLSLWDGDMGLAMFMADCLDANAAFPTLDYF